MTRQNNDQEFIKILLWLITFIILTAISQIGGFVFIISLIINIRWSQKFLFKPIITFLVPYIVLTFVNAPLVSPIFGREKVDHTDFIQPATFMTDFLNRNCVKPEINQLVKEAESSLHATGIKIIYLDTNFPFIDGFPLPPHLSHNDGKKNRFCSSLSG